jgi:hypothetical protein
VNDDNLSLRLKEAVRAETAGTPPLPDIDGAVRAGRRLLWWRWGGAVLALILVVGSGRALRYELSIETSVGPTKPPGDRSSTAVESDEMQADPPEIDEPTERAVVHAIRALVQADLFDPQGDLYSYRRGEATEEGWTVTFNRLLCGRFGDVETCRPVHESGPDSPVAKARLEIVEQDGSLVVEGAS